MQLKIAKWWKELSFRHVHLLVALLWQITWLTEMQRVVSF